MNFIEETLVAAIEEIIKKEFGIEKESGLVMLEIPNKTENGDYATNIAMRLTKRVGKAPRDVASVIVEGLSDHEMISSIVVAGPGFINFFIKPDVMAGVIPIIRNLDRNYGSSDFGEGRKILLEYVSANPTGQLHVGHARGAAWGDSLLRILNFAGYKADGEFYVNDLGNQITMLSHSLFARYQQALGVDAKMPEDGYHAQDIKDIALDVIEQEGDVWLDKDQSLWEPYFKELGIKFELDRIKRDLVTFNVRIDNYVSEKSLYDEGRVEKSLNELKDRGFTYEADGALWLRTTDFKDDKDRVMIKSDGSYTYLVPDIGYHLYKLERGYDELIDLLGGDHHGYIARMEAALEALGYKDVFDVDIIQMVRLIEDGVEVVMSKRTGNAVGLIELVDDIGVDATRYFFVSRALQTPLDFDMTLARSKANDNPVFYAQYAHARICSILRTVGSVDEVKNLDALVHPKEIELLKHLNEFPSVVADAAKSRQVHKVANYIHNLSSLFHSFYGAVKVIDTENADETAQRVLLLDATRITLRNALDLIGVSAPEKM
ncbi:MAG: arginine--tRNA ligase [Erysipelothrix sp.]|nr:arginine--tRNA ligase [Erysipelothrix sp.]